MGRSEIALVALNYTVRLLENQVFGIVTGTLPIDR
jgi:hypothetical protein